VDVWAVFGTQRIGSADAHAFESLLEMPTEGLGHTQLD
jgi:hypothetical protein